MRSYNMYKKTLDINNNSTDNVIIKIEGNVLIPKDEANTDYQEYLKWVAEGNTPEEAE